MRTMSNSNVIGRLRANAINDSLIQRTIAFVADNLEFWRDDPTRPRVTLEEELNAQLANFLGAKATHEFPMVQFQHEQRQAGQRRVDLSAKPTSPIIICGTYYSIYKPFTVIEGKRLPAPDAAREKEYVSGCLKKSGGIQRFKLGLHGADHEEVMMIGYIQADSPMEWHNRINQWIGDLACTSEDGCDWNAREVLSMCRKGITGSFLKLTSIHSRNGQAISQIVKITHLWVVIDCSIQQ